MRYHSVSKEIESILLRYSNDKKYGNLRKGFWENIEGKEILWQLYYDDKDNSTMSINFKRYDNFLFSNYYVSEKMIKPGIREDDFRTIFLHRALTELETRTSEIPYEIVHIL